MFIRNAKGGLGLIFAATLSCLEAVPAGAITITIDYTYDSPANGGSNFFGSGNPQGAAAGAQAKATLEAAAEFFNQTLKDCFSPITVPDPYFSPLPGSKTRTWWWEEDFKNPSTGAEVELKSTDTNPHPPLNILGDQYIIYAGARPFTGSDISEGAYGGSKPDFTDSGTGLIPAQDSTTISDIGSSFFSAVESRGQSSGFSRWGGTVSFNPGTNWHFDYITLPPSGRADFYSFALHELGHALGMAPANDSTSEWSKLIKNGTFTGTNAVSKYGGPVPVATDSIKYGHWAQGTLSVVYPNGSPQEASMTPFVANPGQRKYFTALDVAGLKDIGWTDVPATYTFKNIVDTNTDTPWGTFLHFDDAPEISGTTAAFRGVFRNGDDGIFTGNGGTLTKIVMRGDSTSPGGPVISGVSNTAISGSTAGFRGTYTGGPGIFTGSGGPLTKIVKITDPAPIGNFTDLNGSPAISGSLVAFHGGYSDAASGNFGQGIFTGSGGTPTTIAKTGDKVPTEPSKTFTTFDYFNQRSISGAWVSFIGNYSGGGSSGSGVFTGRGGVLTKVVKSGEQLPLNPTKTFTSFSSTAISGITAAFIGTYTGGNGIFTGSGGPLTTIATTDDLAPAGYFHSFDGLAISGSTVAFHGTYLGGSGIFIGCCENKWTTVIKEGDSLFGSTVNGLSSSTFGPSGLDADGSGNLAFLYSLADGRKGVAIAMRNTALTIAADYNGDGTLNAADYIAWRKDPNRTQAGYDLWRGHFGQTGGNGASEFVNLPAAGIPEPGSMFLICMGAIGHLLRSARIRNF